MVQAVSCIYLNFSVKKGLDNTVSDVLNCLPIIVTEKEKLFAFHVPQYAQDKKMRIAVLL